MGMSQEEIEALMNGLDIDDGPTTQEESKIVEEELDTKEIEELISKSQEETLQTEERTILQNTDEIETLLKDIDEVGSKSEDLGIELDSLNELELENSLETKADNEKDLDAFFEESSIEIPLQNEKTRSEDEIVNDWASSKIDEGIIPTPAHHDAKVVSQLSQVANDSEEKVSQIFDVLSLALDNNGELRKSFKDCASTLEKEEKLLNNLIAKFPNIPVFKEHLDGIKSMNESLNRFESILNDEDNSIFQAMELMQFNDINRQKIERVMFVIRKLSTYLNNLFEDESDTSSIAVAKHIHGDDNDDLAGDDLDKLIEEFSKNS